MVTLLTSALSIFSGLFFMQCYIMNVNQYNRMVSGSSTSHARETLLRAFAHSWQQQCFPNFIASARLLVSKDNHGSSPLPHGNIECPDDRYPKLKIYISVLMLDSYEYIAVVYVTMHCMIWP